MSNNTVQINQLLAAELNIRPEQVQSATDLLDSGATVPFIARYRKEVTGALDDNILRQLEVRLLYLRELQERRITILASIKQQGKLSPELEAKILASNTKQQLEDLYAPYKPKRRTKAQIAKEAGLEPLADAILANKDIQLEHAATEYIKPDTSFTDTKTVLNGARDILAERFAEDATLLATLRETLWQQGYLYSKVNQDKADDSSKFSDYFDFHERLKKLPSHRILALLRGRQQGILDLNIGLDSNQEELEPHPLVARIAEIMAIDAKFDGIANERQQWLAKLCYWCWKVKLLTSFETELIARLREAAEAEAIRVFAANLKDLLLAAPAGPKAVLGLDPGIRTGVKVAAIDATGKLLDTAVIYPFAPRNDITGSIKTLDGLIKKFNIALVAIGNGTASRETESLVKELQQQHSDLQFKAVVVSESGASVYSASELAAKEFPELDVSLRGAVSIARRLQDPLAELVKIDPKAIGVGQYQHDVNQKDLARSLDAVVEDCVNAVGVDVNTASAQLLSRVSGLNSSLAQNIVQWREANGAFKSRKLLLKVPRFGDKTFEQAAGFLRILDSDNLLDASAVHPEAYPVVEQIILKTGKPITALMGHKDAIKNISPKEFITSQFGLPTINDILAELEKPGRDPRPEFKTASFMEGILDIKDLQAGMTLEGVVSNVANFGAFVNIGVHQDGLVHISELADKFVSDPRDVVRVGETVKVRVLEVDVQRKRISLSMRSQQADKGKAAKTVKTAYKNNKPQPVAQGAMAEAFAKLKR